jgi:hypothetical protein
VELFDRLVEAARNVPPKKRDSFMVVETAAYTFLSHPGLQDEDESRVHLPDLKILIDEKLLIATYHGSTLNVDVSPLGFRYYGFLRERDGDAPVRVERELRRLIDVSGFSRQHPTAYQSWEQAEKLLWSSETTKQLTTIGHLCREALQHFATGLVSRYPSVPVPRDVSKIVARVRAVLVENRGAYNSTRDALMDALLVYWGTVSDMVQRQEHGAQKEGEVLVWEDGRSVVFHTITVMLEIHRRLPQQSGS